ncbi:uncharacterized protein jsrp1.L [Xenopus laevis]|uniref:Junctional sarcoplasmic reticulum protein 1 n=2 Tax=Xenopus laevis TaxID=8355 RepID=A0A974E0E1_XENLA|nr:uncharacterized protein jsrp1.L [Xenopus laevis]OCU00557.1 hypothetical protein XELAEV_18006335mg [Xenopus laevis]
MEGPEREAAYVEDLPVSEGKPVAASKEEAVTSKATVIKSKVKCELQITEDLDEFADVGEKKNNEPEEIPQPPIPKEIKRTVVEPKPAPKSAPVKKKLEPKSVGPMKEEEYASWNGITLNKCLVIAAFAALISVGFQVLQEVADDDELTDLENEPWTPSDPNDQLSDPWFFEGWFGSSEEEKAVSEANLPDVELPEVENDEPVEDEITSVEETLVDAEDEKEEALEVDTEVEKSLSKVERNEQWGLKDKSKYMVAKAIKIRRASEEGSHKKGLFPFMKKTKEPSKYKEKPNKEREYSHEHKYEHNKKHDEGKQYKKDKEEQKKYFIQEEKERYKGWKADKEKGWKAVKEKGWKADKEKGWKADKEKGYKHYQYDKGFKKSQDSRRHG